MQITDSILMVRPASFGFNEETATDNHFQKPSAIPSAELHQMALKEFDTMADQLSSKGINIIIAEDSMEPRKPDAIFPNNWFSTTDGGGIHIFPMYAGNRRLERTSGVIPILENEFKIDFIKDWSHLEKENNFLEGTGSMVMDHENKIIYACLSERTKMNALQRFSEASGYKVMPFIAEGEKGIIYHTNVMMSIGEGFAILCPKVITDHTERIAVSQLLESSAHENIYVDPDAMNHFACNLLHVKNTRDERFIVISQAAMGAVPSEKIKRLEQFGTLIPVDVSTIENVNGGSVRCMMAEIFLPRLNQESTER